MKKLFALLFISMISGMIMAQIPEVSGTIVFKKDGQPVVGALVSVLGRRYTPAPSAQMLIVVVSLLKKEILRKGTENTGKNTSVCNPKT